MTTEFAPGDLVMVRYPLDGLTDSDPESWPWLPAIVLDRPQDPVDEFRGTGALDHFYDPPMMWVVVVVGTLAYTQPGSGIDCCPEHRVDPHNVLSVPARAWQREVARYLYAAIPTGSP